MCKVSDSHKCLKIQIVFHYHSNLESIKAIQTTLGSSLYAKSSRGYFSSFLDLTRLCRCEGTVTQFHETCLPYPACHVDVFTRGFGVPEDERTRARPVLSMQGGNEPARVRQQGAHTHCVIKEIHGRWRSTHIMWCSKCTMQRVWLIYPVLCILLYDMRRRHMQAREIDIIWRSTYVIWCIKCTMQHMLGLPRVNRHLAIIMQQPNWRERMSILRLHTQSSQFVHALPAQTVQFFAWNLYLKNNYTNPVNHANIIIIQASAHISLFMKTTFKSQQ